MLFPESVEGNDTVYTETPPQIGVWTDACGDDTEKN